MVEEGYDLVIWVNPDPDISLVGRVFLGDRLVTVAPAGMNYPKDDTVVPVVLRGTPRPRNAWTITADVETVSFNVETVLSLSSLLNVRDAVRMGFGAGRLPISLVGGDIASGRMVKWGEVAGSEIALWALYPRGGCLAPAFRRSWTI